MVGWPPTTDNAPPIVPLYYPHSSFSSRDTIVGVVWNISDRDKSRFAMMAAWIASNNKGQEFFGKPFFNQSVAAIH
jgi:hypothetical protein